MRTGRWRHRRCTEIDILITKVQYRDPKRVVAKVLYLNRQATLEKNQLMDTRPERVTILAKDFKNWSPVV